MNQHIPVMRTISGTSQVVIQTFHYILDYNIANDQSANTHVFPVCSQMGQPIKVAMIMCYLAFIVQTC